MQMARETESRSDKPQVLHLKMLILFRQIGSMTEKVTEYERVLNSLVGRVSDVDAALIRSVLEKVS